MATAVVVSVAELVKPLPVHRNSVAILSCSGPSAILGADRKQKPVLGGVRIVALSISCHEQTQ